MAICTRCGNQNYSDYQMCDGCRKYHRNYKRRWCKDNPGRGAEIAKRYRIRNSETVRESRKKYVETHPDIIKHAQQNRDKDRHAEIKRKRRRIKLNSRGSFTQKEFYRLCKAFNYKCLKCGNKFNIGGMYGLVADHITPLSKSGSDYIFNIQCLCGKCNRQKHTKTIDYRPLIPDFIKEKAHEISYA